VVLVDQAVGDGFAPDLVFGQVDQRQRWCIGVGRGTLPGVRCGRVSL
jgi:hypothetical protein